MQVFGWCMGCRQSSLLQWLFAIGAPLNRCKYDLKLKVNLKTIRRKIVAPVLKHRVGGNQTLWVFLTPSLCVDGQLYCTVGGGSHCTKLIDPNETGLTSPAVMFVFLS